jgi:hypothetical protein
MAERTVNLFKLRRQDLTYFSVATIGALKICPRTQFNRPRPNLNVAQNPTTEFLGQRWGRFLKFQHQATTHSGTGKKVTHNINVVGKTWQYIGLVIRKSEMR